MKRRVKSRPAADVDVEDVAAWYDGERPGLGEEFVEDVDGLTARISDNAFQFPVVLEDVRRAMSRRFPYGVFFVVEGAVATIVAVLHLHRASDVLLNRMRTDG